MARGVKGTQEPELTPKQFEQMAMWLGMGLTVTEVCQLTVVTTQTFYKWLKVGQQRTDPDDPLRRFADAVHKGKLSAKAHALTAIQFGMKKDWKAAAWYLGVTYPAAYGQKVRLTLEEEFGSAIENIEQDFADEPELLGKILASITRRQSRRGEAEAGPEAVERVEPEDPDAP